MRRTRSARAVWLAALLVAATLALPAAARADSAGWQVGSAVSSLVYAPVKVAYAATGLVFGGIGWGLSGGNSEVAEAIIAPAVTGDYLVTPSHLRRQRSLAFFGRSTWREQPDPEPDPDADVYGELDWDY